MTEDQIKQAAKIVADGSDDPAVLTAAEMEVRAELRRRDVAAVIDVASLSFAKAVSFGDLTPQPVNS